MTPVTWPRAKAAADTPEALIATVAKTVVPSLKTMLPVAVLAPAVFGVTVAVNVTAAPADAGFADDVNAVVVDVTAELMVSVSAVDELVAK